MGVVAAGRRLGGELKESRKLPRLQELQANPAAASRDVTSCRADCCAAPAGRARRCPSGPRAARAPGCTQRNGDGHTERRQRPTPEREPGRGRGGTPSSREGDKNGMEPAWPLASPSPGPQGSAWAGSACLSPLLLPSLKASGVLVPDQGSRRDTLRLRSSKSFAPDPSASQSEGPGTLAS